MKLLDMTRKYGNATHEYPFAPYEVAEGFRGKPEYTYELCIGCTACAVACPSNAMNVQLNEAKDKLVWKFDCGRCIYCGRCDEVCPTGAVALGDNFETAVRLNKEDLIETGELELQACVRCNVNFTTKRLIAYCIENFINVGWSKEQIDHKAVYIKTCPTCKKEESVGLVVGHFYKGGVVR
ncbi:MAG: 4Fe-4S dicluster domain-containing protein [Sulfurovum sp.]|nr:4Fe-4S dicluster domain-containing protein [Sulfurovum sp.]